MWIIFGSVGGERDLGVVAELCPHCARATPCRVTALTEGVHLYFITLASNATAAAARCTLCGGQVPCELWRYPDFVAPGEARGLGMEELLQRTNPGLRDRLEWARKRSEFADDPRFTTALDSVEQLRLGPLRAGLLEQLHHWDRLGDRERSAVVETAGGSARALEFAATVVKRLPTSWGCLVGAVVSLGVWSAFFWAPAVRELAWGVVTGLAGLAAGAAVFQLLQSSRIRRWTREVLIPEGEKADLDYESFARVLRDLPPPGPYNQDELRRLREDSAAILQELAACGKISGDQHLSGSES
jgi:hypothetical protein